jgi:8-oxo-dGTP pyrophosphatase MutT (NUDIX family)
MTPDEEGPKAPPSGADNFTEAPPSGAADHLTMSSDRPDPGQEINPGRRTEPRPAGTVILLRGGADTLEVLLVRRTPSARFMGGAWVFPGGAVDPADGRDDAGHRAAAIRELEEEAGIAIADPQQLVPYSRWITPPESKIRFDTWFYLAPAPAGAEARVDGSEVIEARWYEPAGALAARERGELFLVFPTIKHLQQLSGFASADELLAHAAGREVHPIQPRVVLQGETARIVLPGEPGYED